MHLFPSQRLRENSAGRLQGFIALLKSQTDYFAKGSRGHRHNWMHNFFTAPCKAKHEGLKTLTILAHSLNISYRTRSCACYSGNMVFCASRQMVYDPEIRRCAQLTVTGKMMEVAPEELSFAKQAMFSR